MILVFGETILAAMAQAGTTRAIWQSMMSGCSRRSIRA
ncbi:Uncharacterised protein [Neisseria meningitidis]|nr:hypothetical protein NM3222_1757 [Neisseria meningitidis NM3222]EOC69316.1 hypothetical protein NM3158_1749 [Neisseria meningitidis NM3158]EOC71191.1 hypothetical protein NM3164_1770 [Neisseria meningitidis NM3164]CWP30448.1 Uncharacterised protein [Neisseria meningitidis]CWP39569.1 Uncharacterised protein [Neisseria meningitidis]